MYVNIDMQYICPHHELGRGRSICKVHKLSECKCANKKMDKQEILTLYIPHDWLRPTEDTQTVETVCRIRYVECQNVHEYAYRLIKI